MRRDPAHSRSIQNLVLSVSAHLLCLVLVVTIPNCTLRRRRKVEHKIYTFALIDPATVTMKKTAGVPAAPPPKAAPPPPKKEAVKVKKEEPRKKEAPKKKPEKKQPAKKPEKKPAKKPAFSKKTVAEKIKEQLKKIEEESKSRWVEPDKAQELLAQASRGKVAEQGIAGLLNTGDFLNVSYNDAVASLIYQAWQPPSKTPADKENVTTVIRFAIARDGAVSNARVEKRSGIGVLDASALQAIKDSSPLPPLPDDFTGESLEVVMTFVPVPEE